MQKDDLDGAFDDLTQLQTLCLQKDLEYTWTPKGGACGDVACAVKSTDQGQGSSQATCSTKMVVGSGGVGGTGTVTVNAAVSTTRGKGLGGVGGVGMIVAIGVTTAVVLWGHRGG